MASKEVLGQKSTIETSQPQGQFWWCFQVGQMLRGNCGPAQKLFQVLRKQSLFSLDNPQIRRIGLQKSQRELHRTSRRLEALSAKLRTLLVPPPLPLR
jgi:hypothetical protein